MLSPATIIFWTCSALLLYLYVVYPPLVRLLAIRFGRPIVRGNALPTVTVIVTAYNEEKSIVAKLSNLASLDYPASLLNVLVASAPWVRPGRNQPPPPVWSRTQAI
jgi:cellulose synthase/poly-beta-1,6-N-acetylglucosamine synthase-like glycosyltransferase